MLHITSSKTDQYNVGCVRNQYRTGVDLCPVLALEEYERHFPERLHGSGRSQPVCRWECGAPIRREEVQHYLVVAALASGLRGDTMGSHSLRIGGATAMYHSVEDLQKVKRFGRWASDSFHSYLWESHEPMRGVAQRMAVDDSELTAPREGAHGWAPAGADRRGGGRTPPGAPGGRAPSVALAAAVAASTLGQAAGQAVQAYASPAGVLALTSDEEGVKVVLTITVMAALRALALCVLVAIGLMAGGYWLGRRHMKAAAARAPAGPEPGRAPRRAKKAFCDAGVQGPVHYTGDRYLHDSQGFRRAWEIERTPAARPHGE